METFEFAKFMYLSSNQAFTEDRKSLIGVNEGKFFVHILYQEYIRRRVFTVTWN